MRVPVYCKSLILELETYNDTFILPDFCDFYIKVNCQAWYKNDSLISSWLKQHWTQNFLPPTQKTKRTKMEIHTITGVFRM